MYRVSPLRVCIKHPAVDAAALVQLVVGARLQHPPAVEDDDPVRVDDRRQAVRDHERGAAAHQLLERALHRDFAVGVQR